MLENERAIVCWRKTTETLRKKVVSVGVGACSAVLAKAENPGTLDFQAASRAASAAVIEQATSPEWLSALGGEISVSPDKREAIKLSFGAVRPDLRLPAPTPVYEFSPIRIGLVALIGALVGMMSLSPLTRYLLGMEDVGTFVGAPVGAFLMVVGVWNAARNERLRKLLLSLFGVAAVAEIWGIIGGRGIVGSVWRKLGGRHSGVKRLLVFTAAIILLVTTKPQRRFERSEYEQNAGGAIEQWLDAVIPILGLLLVGDRASDTEGDVQEKFSELVRKVLELHSLPPENLPLGIEELIQTVKNLGFETEKQAGNVFRWRTEDQERYGVIGYVETGDRVVVEREAVVLKGDVRKKGKVRKVRSGG